MKKDKNKQLQKVEKKETALIRSSAGEYLTFVAAAGSSETSVEMRYEDENIWLTKKTVCVKQVVAFFSNEVPSSTAQFSHGLRRAIGGPFSAMRELCYTVPYSNGYAACLSAVFSAFCCLNFFKVTVVPGSQFLVLPDHLSGCFDLAF